MASIKYLENVDLGQNEMQNARVQNLASAPGTPVEGQVYYDTTDNTLYVRGPSSWLDTTATGGTVDFISNVAQDTIIGRVAAGTGNSEELTATQVRSLIQVEQNADVTDEANVTSSLSGATLTDVSPATDDKVLIQDTSDANNLRTLTAQEVADLYNTAASDTTAGIVELATIAETETGTDATRAVTPDALQGLTDVSGYVWVLDEDDLVSDSATKVPTQQSVKAYVDALSQGLDVKDSVRAATTAAQTLSTDFENGDTIDGVVLSTGDRVLVKDQGAGAENGIYTVNVSGAPTRATDADVNADVTAGMFTFVEEGTANADSGWVLSTNDPITVGTTALTFVQFSGAGQITAGDGLTKTGNTINVVGGTGITAQADQIDADAATSTSAGISELAIASEVETGTDTDRTITPGALAGATTLANQSWFLDEDAMGSNDATKVASQQSVKAYVDNKTYAETFGGSVAEAITHNLGTRDVIVEVYDAATYETVICDVVRTDTNNVTLNFATAPGASSLRVVVRA